MLKEFFTAALGMQNNLTRLEVTANNMANVNTAGYRRSEVFERNLIDARANFYNVPGDVEQNDPPVGSYFDWKAGSFQKTDNPLDIAVGNSGFFVLQDEAGKNYLSRNGSFKLDTDGTVTAMDGKKLMGEGGPINIYQEAAKNPLITNDNKSVNIKIGDNGEIYVNDYNAGKLLMAEVKNPESLERISNTDFIATDTSDVRFMSGDEVSVRQGWLEGSNVDIIKEMVQMIELQRMFEAGSKVITTNNDTLDKSIAMGKYV